jgi:predicted Zn-dependent protease
VSKEPGEKEESARVQDLRRRVQREPSSFVFGQLAEALRRRGELQESVDICRAGLAHHPGYLAARATLGWALVGLGRLDEAERELGRVQRRAPENLTAIRGLAEVQRRRQSAAGTPHVSCNSTSPLSSTHAGDAARALIVLEQWLAAIHVSRTQRRA